MDPRALHRAPRLRIVADGRVLLALWRDTPTLADLRALRSAVFAHQQGLGGARQAFLNLIAGVDVARPPDDQTQDAAYQLLLDAAPGRCCTAYVVPVPGFVGVGVCAVLSGWMQRGRPASPTRVFRTLSAAAPWVVGHLRDRGWSPEHLLRLADSARDLAPAPP